MSDMFWLLLGVSLIIAFLYVMFRVLASIAGAVGALVTVMQQSLALQKQSLAVQHEINAAVGEMHDRLENWNLRFPEE